MSVGREQSLPHPATASADAAPKTWNRYIKKIPDDRYFLLPSCVLGAAYPSTEAMMPRLLDLLDLDWQWNLRPESMCTCCSGIGYHGDITTIESSLLTIARLWSIAQEAGYDTVICACVTSFGLHSECYDLYQHEPGLKAKIDRLLMEACGRTFELPNHILHVSDVVYRHRFKIRDELLRYSLVEQNTGRPLRVVDHVGCHYSKLFPSERSVGGGEYCQVLSSMATAWGGAPVDYPERRHCCGMGFRQSMITSNRSYSASCVNKKMESMEPFRPDLIVTNCPGCQVHMDKQQWAIRELTGKEYFIPVLTYMELVGLLAGWDPYDIVGLQFHTVPVEPLLDKIGMPYNESLCWLGKDGQTLPCSEEILAATRAAGRSNKGQVMR